MKIASNRKLFKLGFKYPTSNMKATLSPIAHRLSTDFPHSTQTQHRLSTTAHRLSTDYAPQHTDPAHIIPHSTQTAQMITNSTQILHILLKLAHRLHRLSPQHTDSTQFITHSTQTAQIPHRISHIPHILSIDYHPQHIDCTYYDT